MNSPDKITVESSKSKALWTPKVGSEATLLLDGFDEAAADKILSENTRILSMCLPPTGATGHRTGIVIGYVQSGKTLSFTTVTALARDNAFRFVILLAGTKTNLLDQNEDRLTGDLGILGDRGKFWRVLVNPRDESSTAAEIEASLRRWEKYGNHPDRCRTLLFVVMKNSTRLNNLRKLLQRCDLTQTCGLIIDDEGDQAGLNTKVRQNEESATYAKILALRNVIPNHTYLQYTATPQAPLLISRIDRLSPEFAEILDPGIGYVGGKDLFKSGSPFVCLIPSKDLPPTHSADDGPPESLERAMRLFFLGVAQGVLEGRSGNRSMMIHPSHLTSTHETYATWAQSIKSTWLAVLDEPDDSADKAALRADFQTCYDNLAATDSNLPSFQELWDELQFAMEDTMIRVVNANNGRIPTFPWSDSYGFILVGGAGLDRGFTVEGLTVTYMPRGAGTRTADTIQQRARFFGYKGKYKGLVRIFVDQEVRDAYSKYVQHEENLRESLKQHRGRPLADWKRAFFLDKKLQPTRRSVMALDVMRGRSKEWVYAAVLFDNETDMASHNRTVVDSYVGALGNQLHFMDGSSGWTDIQQHKVVQNLSLAEVYERLLVPLQVEDEEDVVDHLMVMMQIRAALDEDGNAGCDLFLMSGGLVRERTTTKAGDDIENLFQGANPGNGYPGDRAIRSPNRVTIQIHHLNVVRNKTILAKDVRAVAISVPESMRNDVVFE